MPSEYRVIWEIDIAANSPLEAAREALRIQHDSESQATAFTVIDSETKRRYACDPAVVDSEEED